MRSPLVIRLLPFLLLPLLSAAQTDQPLPKIEGESFTGREVVLPDDAKGDVTVLIFGFSKASKTPTSAWAKRLSADLGSHTGFQLYQLPVLEDVPRFIRGMVVSSMKKGVPESARDHFVPILQHEAELKKSVHYDQPDDAYLVVLDRTGKVARMTHGAPNDSDYSALRQEIETLLNSGQ